MFATLFGLTVVALGILFVLDVLLGRPGFDLYAGQGAPKRLGLCEFATRLAPLFLSGIGIAVIAGNLFAGALLLSAAAALALAGVRCRQKA